MRRLRVEWLVLPLALLPVVVAGMLCMLARSSCRAQIAPFLADGRAEVEARLNELPDGGADLRQRFRDEFESADVPPGWRDIPVEIAGHEGIVRLAEGALSSERWLCGDKTLTGLSAAALADAQVRLEIESGRAPVEFDGASATDRLFAEALSAPTLATLRETPLPAATKAYIIRRRMRSTPNDPIWQQAEELMDVLAAVESSGQIETLIRRVGRHCFGGGAFLSFGVGKPFLVVRSAQDTHQPSLQVELPDTPDVQLFWFGDGGADADLKSVAWTGHLDQPLAGAWAVLLPDDGAWWKGTQFRRWFALGAALILVLAAAPVMLFVSLRRRARLDEARARFLNEIAHDLRTPLTSLRLYAEMLTGADVAPDARERYADVIAREAARLTSLLANLLDLSRLEDGKRAYDVQDLNIANAIESATADFLALYPGRAGDLRVAGANDVFARGDPTAFARCLGNLLDNAGKFTESGVAIEIAWHVTADKHVCVTVADEGPGIAASELQTVFTRYARGVRAQADGIPGTGLGLSLVKELMEGVGGSVAVIPDGEKPTGAVFTLRLPAAPRGGARA